MVQSRIPMIVLNSDLPESLQRVILSHELGHAVLHRKHNGLSAFHDFELFDETSRFEYEANIFAAEYLMQDAEVLELMRENTSFFDAARVLRVPVELLDFKLRILKRKGRKKIDPPLMASGDFLKRVNCDRET